MRDQQIPANYIKPENVMLRHEENWLFTNASSTAMYLNVRIENRNIQGRLSDAINIINS